MSEKDLSSRKKLFLLKQPSELFCKKRVLNPIQGGRWGGRAKGLGYQFCSKLLAPNLEPRARALDLEPEPRAPLKKIDFSGQILIKLRL